MEIIKDEELYTIEGGDMRDFLEGALYAGVILLELL
jgi:hypothetical protein